MGGHPWECSLCCGGPHKAEPTASPTPTARPLPLEGLPDGNLHVERVAFCSLGSTNPSCLSEAPVTVPAWAGPSPRPPQGCMPLQTHGWMGSAGSTYELIDDRETGLGLLIPKQSSCLFSVTFLQATGFPGPQGALLACAAFTKERREVWKPRGVLLPPLPIHSVAAQTVNT